MIQDKLARFQSDLLPDGSLQIEGFWQKIAQETPEDPVIGPLEQKLSARYLSLNDADQAALAFPAFSELSTQFSTSPFSTIAALLWELRAAQAEQAGLGNPIPGPTTEPPFEGAP